MVITEDAHKGLLTVDIDGTGANVRRFGRMKYDGSRRHFQSDSAFVLRDFVAFPTKAEALAAARTLRFRQYLVEKIGSRFWSCWGLRHDIRDRYFLLNSEALQVKAFVTESKAQREGVER